MCINFNICQRELYSKDLRAFNKCERKKQSTYKSNHFVYFIIVEIIKSYFNVVPNVPNTQIFRECLKLSKNIDILEFQKLVIQKLKFRNISNPESFKERQIPEALKHICYSLNFSDNEYQQLDNFLSQKSKVCISHMLEVNNLN